MLRSNLLRNGVTASAKLRLPSFEQLKLNKKLLQFLQGEQIHTPTFIQYALVSEMQREPTRHYHIVSPTGSGKTLAYLLPIFNALKQEEEDEGMPLTLAHRPRALVLTTTKELVLQSRAVAKQISHHSKIRVEGINIGRSIADEKKIIAEGVDILISTHERIKNAFKRDQIKLNNLSYLVVDEVDTLYDNDRLQQIMDGFIKPLSTKIKVILSSTTISPLLSNYLEKCLPQLRRIQDKQTHINLSNIKHEFTQCFTLDKHQKLLEILLQQQTTKTMVFCTKVSSLHQLQYYLNNQGITVVSLHSQLPKLIRLQNYQTFRDMQGGVMLATDLGARGLDFPNLDRVINYDFPSTTADYLQRAGRTGRAGRKGLVISIYHLHQLKIINELRDASFHSPLRISNSAYALRNRENIGRNKYRKQ